jgi:hypothetical protein
MALLRVDPGLVIWLWITFGIILLVLRLTVWKQITGGLDRRSERIASDLESARAAGEKAGAVLAEYDQKIREGRAEAAPLDGGVDGPLVDVNRAVDHVRAVTLGRDKVEVAGGRGTSPEQLGQRSADVGSSCPQWTQYMVSTSQLTTPADGSGETLSEERGFPRTPFPKTFVPRAKIREDSRDGGVGPRAIWIL